ncbi:hypothetical protein [Candidatus Regiella endosymbiont of Tuberolachnus salignus]|uniref:hypothetical protein n=1 Tax=Candidatus Regiella endosymbiont of Tuberolachnus salignus TaxID=3077956 RepID=UPI0030D54B23
MPNDLLLSGDWPTIIQTTDTTENDPAFINPVCSNLIDVYSSFEKLNSEKPNFGSFDEKEEEDLKLGCVNPNDILPIAFVKTIQYFDPTSIHQPPVSQQSSPVNILANHKAKVDINPEPKLKKILAYPNDKITADFKDTVKETDQDILIKALIWFRKRREVLRGPYPEKCHYIACYMMSDNGFAMREGKLGALTGIKQSTLKGWPTQLKIPISFCTELKRAANEDTEAENHKRQKISTLPLTAEAEIESPTKQNKDNL